MKSHPCQKDRHHRAHNIAERIEERERMKAHFPVHQPFGNATQTDRYEGNTGDNRNGDDARILEEQSHWPRA
jgi:hypothetical protein